jgi:hypothetical protein
MVNIGLQHVCTSILKRINTIQDEHAGFGWMLDGCSKFAFYYLFNASHPRIPDPFNRLCFTGTEF